MSAAVVSLSVEAPNHVDSPDRPILAKSHWSSQDSASPSSSSSSSSAAAEANDKKGIDNQGHAHDDDDSTFSIDMDDLKRDLGMEVNPPVNDGTGSTSFPSLASNTAISSVHDLRSPSPIEVTVQRLSLVKLITPTQLNTSNKEKENTNDASVEKVGEKINFNNR